jgi:hypothetical protein
VRGEQLGRGLHERDVGGLDDDVVHAGGPDGLADLGDGVEDLDVDLGGDGRGVAAGEEDAAGRLRRFLDLGQVAGGGAEEPAGAAELEGLAVVNAGDDAAPRLGEGGFRDVRRRLDEGPWSASFAASIGMRQFPRSFASTSSGRRAYCCMQPRW